MIFRFSFTVTIFVLLLNLKDVFEVPSANLIEKSFLLFSVVILVMTQKINQKVIFILLLIIALCVFSAAITDFQKFSWWGFCKSINQVVIIVLFLSVRLRDDDCHYVLKLVAWLPFFSILIGGIYWFFLDRQLHIREYFGNYPRLRGSLIPAYLGAYCIAGCYAAIRYAQVKDIRYLLVFLLNTSILLLTGSRMAILISVLLCSPIFLKNFQSRKAVGYIVILWVAIGLSLLVVMVKGDIILGRIFKTHLSGRDMIWEYLYEVLKQYWWSGVGYGHQILLLPIELRNLVGGTVSAHNEYLRIAVEIGFLQAIVFFLLLMIAMVIRARAAACFFPKQVLWAGFLFLIICLTENSISSVSGFLFLVIVVLSSSVKGDLGYHHKSP